MLSGGVSIIVVDHVYRFMTTVHSSFDGYFQLDNVPCHKDKIVTHWFLEHNQECTVLTTGTRSQCNRAPFGMGMGDVHYSCTHDKSAAPTRCYHVSMDQIPTH